MSSHTLHKATVRFLPSGDAASKMPGGVLELNEMVEKIGPVLFGGGERGRMLDEELPCARGVRSARAQVADRNAHRERVIEAGM